MKNLEISEIFYKIADILEIKDDNPFKIRAYRRAAQSLETLAEDIEDIAKRSALKEIPGIGKDLAKKIQEYITTGNISHYEELRAKTPEVALEMLNIQGVGPKTAKLLYNTFKFKTISELEKLAKSHKLSGISGLKDKTEENILRGIELLKKHKERMLLSAALEVSSNVIKSLKKLPEVEAISPAGSLRRMKETIRDVDILVTSNNPAKVVSAFTTLAQAKDILAEGPTKGSILTKEGVQVDLRVVKPKLFGAALVYLTGSKAHNIVLRRLANSLDYKINEYGVFNRKTGKNIASKREIDIYKALGLSYIPPEIREDAGEIEMAAKNALPELIELKDIRGDLHVHSDWSDGHNTISEMAQAASQMGYSYIAISDHTQSLTIAGGLTSDELKEKMAQIKKINKKFKNFKVLTSAEVDILKDGSLDLPDNLLKRLDIVMAAIHSGFKQSKEVITKRIVRAMQSKRVHIITHPTGRLIGKRDPYEVDMDELIRVAKDTNTALEINAFPERLDLNDVNSRNAAQHGVMLAINTDAHITDHLNFMSLGIGVARRGWLTRDNVLNALPLDKLLKRIKK